MNQIEAEAYFNKFVDPFTMDLLEIPSNADNRVVNYDNRFTLHSSVCQAYEISMQKLVVWALCRIKSRVPYLKSHNVQGDFNVDLPDDV